MRNDRLTAVADNKVLHPWRILTERVKFAQIKEWRFGRQTRSARTSKSCTAAMESTVADSLSPYAAMLCHRRAAADGTCGSAGLSGMTCGADSAEQLAQPPLCSSSACISRNLLDGTTYAQH
jgi:hypothetical protein